MNKLLVKGVLDIYLGIRKRSSPFIFKKIYDIDDDGNTEWDTVKYYDMNKFSQFINEYPYSWEKLKGLMDASFPSDRPNYFFSPMNKERDCDDFARIWRLWAEHNGMTGYEYVFVNSRGKLSDVLSTAHVVCIAKSSDEQFFLFNYQPYGPYPSLKGAIDKMKETFGEENCVYSKYDYTREQ